ncbi:unnamed protein product [Paramecium primaurelia]|uniref:Transmembrane protein n=1 Tax=Paramecium primaurelia TaxID=5886 RepID=A0A8S1QBY1_PARPR|nr:unnamed protein product [Paramecium primaurelia]CAD8113176.1 unnamed protein product [Paramecium primaurelia]
MWKTITLFILFVAINGQCSCSKFTDQSSCYAYGYCLFVNGVCSEQKCEAIPYEEKCKSPLCLWKDDKCSTFKAYEETCQALLPQQCTQYQGCYYDYTNLKCAINKDCSSLKIDQCNGKLQNGNSCVADPFNNKCQEMTDCKSLTTEFMCLSQFPQCNYVDSKCQPQVCTDIKDNISCTFIDECQWDHDKCYYKNCQSIAFGYLCNGNTCGFDNNKCFACFEQYSYQLFVGLISLLFIL